MLIRTITIPTSGGTSAPFSGVIGVRDVSFTNLTTDTIQIQRSGSTDKFYIGSGASISISRCLANEIVFSVSSSNNSASAYAYASSPHERV